MNQLGFDGLPALDAHIDFATASSSDERIADIEVVRKLHRKRFKPMDPNNRDAGRVVKYRVKPAELPPLPEPGRVQGVAEAPPAQMMSRAKRDARIREAAALNALTLDGTKVVRPY